MDPKQAASAAGDILSRYDPAAPGAAADGLRDLWLQAAPSAAPALDAGQKQFLRDWGIAQTGFAANTPVPVLTAIGKEIGRRARRQVPHFLPLARLLWEEYGREGRVVAAVALGPMELADPGAVVPVLHDLARTCVFWEDCDQLAMKALEPVLRRDPAAWLEPIGAWVHDENKWVRRAGLTAVGRLPMAHPSYAARCVERLAPALGDPDTDVKRALSFGLRVTARQDVAPVKQFIRDCRGAADAHSLWVFCDVVRSLWPPLLPHFRDLLPVYQAWLQAGPAGARRSLEAAIRLLEA
jgi:3-methyladenine DNA glycosylase AlkD